ncbi:MAG TPA: hypothetical protein VJ476_10135 [Rhizomicrobium sp.]|nr:hypothetical protein [Rhizomicrobium sp.]
MANTLGLGDDLDSVELVQDIEKAFDVEIANAEAERLLVVGQLYDLLVSKIPASDANKKCASAMTFYRLRQGMERLGFGRKLSPSADIRFLEKSGASRSFKRLERETGLTLPKLVMTWIGGFGCLLSVASICVAIVAALFFHRTQSFLPFLMLLLLLAVGTGFAVTYLDPGKLTQDCRTLGGLSKRTAAQNFGKLAELGARNGSEDIWNSLVDLLSNYSLPKSEITRETYFLQSQLKRSAQGQV